MIAEAVEAIAKMLAEFFRCRTTTTSSQATTEVIGDKHELERACQYAELAIEIVERSALFSRHSDKRRFDRLVKKFRKMKCS